MKDKQIIIDGETFARPEIKQILQKSNECEVKNDNK